MAEAYRHESIEFVVNQSIWMEGETQFADIILPACTSSNATTSANGRLGGGYLPARLQRPQPSRHRPAAQVHRAARRVASPTIDIFSRILQRLGLGAMFTEGCSELDWVQARVRFLGPAQARLLEGVLPKGYFVVPAEQPGLRAAGQLALVRRRPAQRTCPSRSRCPRNRPENSAWACRRPAASSSSCPRSCKRARPDNPERPVLNRYIPSWEGPRTTGARRPFPAADDRDPFALQLPHQCRRQEQLHQRHRGPSRPASAATTSGCCA